MNQASGERGLNILPKNGKINSQLKLSIYSVDSRVALALSADEAFIRMAIFFSAEAQNQQPTGNTKLRSVWSAGIRTMASIWCSHTCKVQYIYTHIYIYIFVCECVCTLYIHRGGQKSKDLFHLNSFVKKVLISTQEQDAHWIILK